MGQRVNGWLVLDVCLMLVVGGWQLALRGVWCRVASRAIPCGCVPRGAVWRDVAPRVVECG